MTGYLANPLPVQQTTVIDEIGRGYQDGRAIVQTLEGKELQDTARLPEPSEEVQTVLRNA
ncbi:hypothetical protein HY641_03370 [Candidatus Woesearchaeota archaeon]|nr:hypothetical protein [Candidatus Woesearchaeota archaeon]